MSTESTTGLYEEDLHGTNPANLITGEVHTLQVPGPTDYYFIIPKAAPFFVDSLQVINHLTGVPYVEGEDYMVGHRFIEAMRSIGRPIAGSIRFMKRSIIGQVRLTYRTIGGQWGFSDQAILAELSRKQYNPLIRSWGNIDVLPASFPPLQHDQPVNSLIGSAEILEALERLADIMEATASGTTESHLEDFNNPHRVTKEQVQLGNVPNFAMATELQHRQANRTDLFTNPAGVLAAIQEWALAPLQSHIDATGNVHDLLASDIGLGNVPNYPPATPEQAIDVTNNITLMTPYTTTLLFQSLQGDPRLDQLIVDFQNHITAINPHGITPALIGTLTTSQIEALIAQGGGSGGDANLFGGETPGEWEAKFPAVSDINTILLELTEVYNTTIAPIGAIDFSDPITPAEKARLEQLKIQWVHTGFDTYALFNRNGDMRIITSNPDTEFPLDNQSDQLDGWLSLDNASYYIADDGSLSNFGTNSIVSNISWITGGGFNPNNRLRKIFGSRNALYLQRMVEQPVMNPGDPIPIEVMGDVFKSVGPTVPVLLYTSNQRVVNMIVGTGYLDPREIGIVERSPLNGGVEEDSLWEAFGNTSWVNEAQAIINSHTVANRKITSVAIGNENLVVTTEGSVNNIWIYQIDFGANITLTDITNTVDIYISTSKQTVKADTLTNVARVTGSYNHYILELSRTDDVYFDIGSFGDDSDGQLEIDINSGPFLSASAGFDYSVTINKLNHVEFWGDSPDNSLVYNGGIYIDPANLISG